MPTNTRTNYEVTTQAAKRAAREERRLKHFLKLSADIYRLEQDTKGVEGLIENETKRKAVREFEFNLMTPKEHPDYENRKKNHDDCQKRSDDAVTNLQKEIERYQKEIADIKANQDKVVSGETKMDYDAILDRAKELVTQAVEKGFMTGEYDKETSVADLG